MTIFNSVNQYDITSNTTIIHTYEIYYQEFHYINIEIPITYTIGDIN
ncbi:MAG: hypothetical protein ACOC2W_01780 [bacterium]